MPWRIVQQPNGLLAKFSEVVDDFTDYDMTQDEAVELCREDMGRIAAIAKVQRGIDAGPGRFSEAMKVIERVHGAETSRERLAELSVVSHDDP